MVQAKKNNKVPSNRQLLIPFRCEPKYIDTGPSAWGCDTTGSVVLLNGVALTTINSEADARVGRQIRVSHIHVRGIINPQDASSGPTLAALYLVLDKQPNGSAPSMTDFLATATSTNHRNKSNLKRFAVLWEAHHAVGQISDTASSSFAGSPTVHVVEHQQKLNVVTQYSGTGATAASIATNALYLISIGNQVANAGASFNATVRLTYTDD